MKKFKTHLERQLHDVLYCMEHFPNSTIEIVNQQNLVKIEEALTLAGIKYESLGRFIRAVK